MGSSFFPSDTKMKYRNFGISYITGILMGDGEGEEVDGEKFILVVTISCLFGYCTVYLHFSRSALQTRPLLIILAYLSSSLPMCTYGAVCVMMMQLQKNQMPMQLISKKNKLTASKDLPIAYILLVAFLILYNIPTLPPYSFLATESLFSNLLQPPISHQKSYLSFDMTHFSGM